MSYIDDYGRVYAFVDPEVIAEMMAPVRCTRCNKFHDSAKVEVVQRYSDCSAWRCPNCKSLIDDRPIDWGGSAVPIERQN